MRIATHDLTFVGLDVHMSSIVAAATIGVSGELIRAKLPGDVHGAVEWVRSLPGDKRVTYEAGPCGFGLARALTSTGSTSSSARPGWCRVRRATRSRSTSATRCC